MALEIERKFKVANDGWRQQVVRQRRIRQAYLAKTDRLNVRVRIAGTETATITIKTAEVGIVRHEYEYSIRIADAEDLLGHRDSALITKVRHIVSRDGVTWEIDVFEGDNAGLVIAEVELERADVKLVLPAWIGEEVTGDRRYYNAELARHPYARW